MAACLPQAIVTKERRQATYSSLGMAWSRKKRRIDVQNMYSTYCFNLLTTLSFGKCLRITRHVCNATICDNHGYSHHGYICYASIF